MLPLQPAVTWEDLAVRLVLTLLAGGLIGFERDEHGRGAGLRTTILVCLAASVAMLQANILLPTVGKQPTSYITLDLMRLPLGILSGVGFLGAGAIIRRSDRVMGLTTAATLWIVTVIGLCFGGGQIALGVIATILGFGVLWGLKIVERAMPQHHKSQLIVSMMNSAGTADAVLRLLQERDVQVISQAVRYSGSTEVLDTRFEVRWRGQHGEAYPPHFVAELAAMPVIRSVEWEPVSSQPFFKT